MQRSQNTQEEIRNNQCQLKKSIESTEFHSSKQTKFSTYPYLLTKSCPT